MLFARYRAAAVDVVLTAALMMSAGCHLVVGDYSVSGDADVASTGDLDGAFTDMRSPDLRSPDLRSPDLLADDAGDLDCCTADRLAPDAAAVDARSDGAAPDTMSAPDTSTPDTSLPDTSLPDTALPDLWVPECVSDNDCLDSDPCRLDLCVDSRCEHPVADSTTSCPDEGDPCTNDHCDGAGGCAHDFLGDGVDCGGGNMCCGGVCTSLDTVDNCGSCGARCAAGYDCIPVPDAPSYYTCTCIGFANCQQGFGAEATCHDTGPANICLCQCPCAPGCDSCTGQCAGGATCYHILGDNYCAYP